MRKRKRMRKKKSCCHRHDYTWRYFLLHTYICHINLLHKHRYMLRYSHRVHSNLLNREQHKDPHSKMLHHQNYRPYYLEHRGNTPPFRHIYLSGLPHKFQDLQHMICRLPTYSRAIPCHNLTLMNNHLQMPVAAPARLFSVPIHGKQ